MIELVATPERGSNGSEPEEQAGPHILLVIDQFARALGGGERVLLEIARLLPQYGFRASILTFSLDPASPVLRRPPCAIYLLPMGQVFSIHAIRSSLAFARFLVKQDVDVVQTFFASADLWAGFVAKAMSRSKVAWFLRDMGFQRTTKQRYAYRLTSGLPDAIFAVSEQVRRRFLQNEQIWPTRTYTIHNGVSPEEWDLGPRLAKSGDRFHITTVGNIRWVKGQDLFIEAAAHVRESFPQATFSIVGEVLEPEFHLALVRRLSALNLHTCRILSGTTDIPRHLAQSDLFVLASRSEGFPNVIIEAMASSLPVVATDVGGSPEAVEHGSSGLIVPAEDATALAAAMLKILSNPSLAMSMGTRGRQIVINRFTTRRMMSEITTVYRSMITAER